MHNRVSAYFFSIPNIALKIRIMFEIFSLNFFYFFIIIFLFAFGWRASRSRQFSKDSIVKWIWVMVIWSTMVKWKLMIAFWCQLTTFITIFFRVNLYEDILWIFMTRWHFILIGFLSLGYGMITQNNVMKFQFVIIHK